MRFNIETSGNIYSDKDKQRLEKLGFGFTRCIDEKYWLIDDERKVFIEINSLEELIKFQEEWGEIIIRDGDKKDNSEKVIEIYNSYRE